MDEKVVGKARMDYTIDLLITMIIEDISDESGRDSSEVLTDFILSKTGQALYDTSNKLWWTGPAYIADLYREENALKYVMNGNI